jgi:tetratricopeptide (TPR) repeat protein
MNGRDMTMKKPIKTWAIVAAGAVIIGAGLLALVWWKTGMPLFASSPAPPPPPVVEETVNPDSALGGYLAALHAQQEHDYANASAFVDRALADDPDNFDLIRRAIVLRLSEGRVSDSVDLARRIVAHDGNNGLAALVLLEQAIKAGDFEGAAKMAATIPRDGAQRYSVPLLLAWSDAARGQQALVAKDIAGTGDTSGLGPLKEIHATLIADVTDQIDQADAGYKAIIAEVNPPSLRVVQFAGNFYERHNRPADASALYQAAAAEDDSDITASGLDRIAKGVIPLRVVTTPADGAAEALFDLASLLDQGETADAALVYAQLALDLKPDFALAGLLIGEIREQQGRNAAALAIYRNIGADSPFYWTAQLRMALVLDALGRTDEAKSELEAMAKDHPGRAEPLVEKGDIERSHSDFTDAAASYTRGLARITDPSPREWRIFYSRGVSYERSDQWPKAEADFKRALELQPDQPLVLNYLGYTWVDKGVNLDQGVHMIQRAVELQPNDGYIVDSLGWAYYRLGDFPHAAETLERAIEMLPEDPTINDHLGDAYWQNGRRLEARYQWRRALQFKPDADETQKIEGKLDHGPSNTGGG